MFFFMNQDWIQNSEISVWQTPINNLTLSVTGESEVLVLPELVQLVARAERVLTSSGGSLLLAGRSGVGRKTAVKVVAARQGAVLHTLNITHSYTTINFKTDLKNVRLPYMG